MKQREAFVATMELATGRGWAEQHDNPDLRASHAVDMLSRWPADGAGMSEAKQGRWLGWLQGSLCALGYLTLDEAKVINMAHRDEAAGPIGFAEITRRGLAGRVEDVLSIIVGERVPQEHLAGKEVAVAELQALGYGPPCECGERGLAPGEVRCTECDAEALDG